MKGLRGIGEIIIERVKRSMLISMVLEQGSLKVGCVFMISFDDGTRTVVRLEKLALAMVFGCPDSYATRNESSLIPFPRLSTAAMILNDLSTEPVSPS